MPKTFEISEIEMDMLERVIQRKSSEQMQEDLEGSLLVVTQTNGVRAIWTFIKGKFVRTEKTERNIVLSRDGQEVVV